MALHTGPRVPLNPAPPPATKSRSLSIVVVPRGTSTVGFAACARSQKRYDESVKGLMQIAEAGRVGRAGAHDTVLRCRMAVPLAFNALMWADRSVHSTTTFLHRKDWRSFKATLECLREKCVTAQPVVVRTSWLPPDTFGECIRRKKRFVVRLNSAMTESQAVETLLHEWAHALAWNYSLDRMARDPDVDRELFEGASHDEAWGCAYSRVWRAFSGQMLTT